MSGSATEIEPPLALVAWIATAQRSLGYVVAAEARDWPLVPCRTYQRVAIHPVRPPLLVDGGGGIVDPWTRLRLAPSIDGVIERLARIDALAAEGYMLTGDAALADELRTLFKLSSGSSWSASDDAALEIYGERLFAVHRSASAIRDALESARRGRLRLVDELAAPEAGLALPEGGEPLASVADLTVGMLDPESFAQTRRVAGRIADVRVVAPGRARAASAQSSMRVAELFAKARLAEVGAPAIEHRATAAAAGWAHYDAWAEQLSGIVAVGEWGGIHDDGFNPVLKAMPVGPDGFVKSDDGPLLPLGYLPFRGSKVYTGADGTIYVSAWRDAGPLVPTAMTPASFLEKMALWRDHPRRPEAAGYPTMQVQARVGKRFWRSLKLDPDPAASDQVFESFVDADIWVERGRNWRGVPSVQVIAAPASEWLALARRLSRASEGAPIELNVGVPGVRELAATLRAEGIAVR